MQVDEKNAYAQKRPKTLVRNQKREKSIKLTS